MVDQTIRLQKFLAENGVASRRKSEELIAQGKVKINGIKAAIGDKVNPYRDIVTVFGKKVERQKEKRYIMLHKPRGFITTMSDEMDRKCITMLLRDIEERVYPIGRLDRESEGLILLTNDGDFANLMMHPKQHVGKTYRVTVKQNATEDQIEKLRTGIVLEGKKTAPAEVAVITKEDNRMVLKFVLYEGRNRQIRKMCEALGLEVSRLKRTAVGELKLGMLPQGKWRDLTETEVRDLCAVAKNKPEP